MLAKYFSDLEVGDKVYHISDKNEIDISEVENIFVNEEFPEFKYIELTLLPIIGEWNYIWLTSAEILLSTLIYGHDFFTVDESIAVQRLNKLLNKINENV